MQIAREFVRALRGKRSQMAFSKRLGYASNVAAQWEGGRRMPTATRCLAIAVRLGLDVNGAFHRFHKETARAAGIGETRNKHGIDDAQLAAWLRALRGTRSSSEIAAASGLSRYQVARALSGSVKPRLPEFFDLVHALTRRLPEFISEFVDIKAVPTAFDAFKRNETARTLVVRHPWCAAVVTLLDTDDYRRCRDSDAVYLAARLPLPEAELDECLNLLLESGVVRVVDGKSTLYRALTVDMAGDTARRLRAHWSAVSAQRVAAPGDGDLFSYNLFSVSLADYERIKALQKDFFREVRAIVAQSTPSECAGMFAWHTVKW